MRTSGRAMAAARSRATRSGRSSRSRRSTPSLLMTRPIRGSAISSAGRLHSAPKAAARGLLFSFGIKPALLFGEPVYQHVDERPCLVAQMPAMRIERVDFDLRRPVVG